MPRVSRPRKAMRAAMEKARDRARATARARAAEVSPHGSQEYVIGAQAMTEARMNRMARMRAGSLVAAMTPRNSVQRGRPSTAPVAEKLAAEFARLAGAEENALSLIQALRNGDIAPTGPMGWMDVKISLVLVQD